MNGGGDNAQMDSPFGPGIWFDAKDSFMFSSGETQNSYGSTESGARRVEMEPCRIEELLRGLGNRTLANVIALAIAEERRRETHHAVPEQQTARGLHDSGDDGSVIADTTNGVWLVPMSSGEYEIHTMDPHQQEYLVVAMEAGFRQDDAGNHAAAGQSPAFEGMANSASMAGQADVDMHLGRDASASLFPECHGMPNSFDTIFGEELWFSGEQGGYDVLATSWHSDVSFAQQSSREHASSFDAAIRYQEDSDDENTHAETRPPSLSIPPFMGGYGNGLPDLWANTAMEDDCDDAMHSQKDSDDEDAHAETGQPSWIIPPFVGGYSNAFPDTIMEDANDAVQNAGVRLEPDTGTQQQADDSSANGPDVDMGSPAWLSKSVAIKMPHSIVNGASHPTAAPTHFSDQRTSPTGTSTTADQHPGLMKRKREPVSETPERDRGSLAPAKRPNKASIRSTRTNEKNKGTRWGTLTSTGHIVSKKTTNRVKSKTRKIPSPPTQAVRRSARIMNQK